MRLGVPILYRLVLRRLVGCAVEDLVSGRLVVRVSDARQVLGRAVRVERRFQMGVLRELEGFGLVSFANRSLLVLDRSVSGSESWWER